MLAVRCWLWLILSCTDSATAGLELMFNQQSVTMWVCVRNIMWNVWQSEQSCSWSAKPHLRSRVRWTESNFAHEKTYYSWLICYTCTCEMILSWKDITASEEGVCLRIHHQHSGLISSCLDGRHHLWMLHCVHRNAIHLQKQQTGVHTFWSKERDLNCDKEELWEPGKNAGSFHSFWYIWIFKWTVVSLDHSKHVAEVVSTCGSAVIFGGHFIERQFFFFK